jgi:hypothetical protein
MADNMNNQRCVNVKSYEHFTVFGSGGMAGKQQNAFP